MKEQNDCRKAFVIFFDNVSPLKVEPKLDRARLFPDYARQLINNNSLSSLSPEENGTLMITNKSKNIYCFSNLYFIKFP